MWVVCLGIQWGYEENMKLFALRISFVMIDIFLKALYLKWVVLFIFYFDILPLWILFFSLKKYYLRIFLLNYF